MLSLTVGVASVDAPFFIRLQNAPFEGRVHSVFERVVNILAGDGELFTLACRDIDNAPNTAVLSMVSFAVLDVCVGDTVCVCADVMSVGNVLRIPLGGVRTWECSLPWYPAAGNALPANLQIARTRLDQRRSVQRAAMSNFDAAAAQLLDFRAACLFEALSQRHFDHACLVAKSMLGLGPGLTPSGDDFLVGLFAVLNIPGSPCRGWLGAGAHVLKDAASLTHPISLAALKCAANGRVRESIVSLIEQMMYGTEETLAGPLECVFAIGSTSGCDIVSGLLCGFEINQFYGREGSYQSSSD